MAQWNWPLLIFGIVGYLTLVMLSGGLPLIAWLKRQIRHEEYQKLEKDEVIISSTVVGISVLGYVYLFIKPEAANSVSYVVIFFNLVAGSYWTQKNKTRKEKKEKQEALERDERLKASMSGPLFLGKNIELNYIPETKMVTREKSVVENGAAISVDVKGTKFYIHDSATVNDGKFEANLVGSVWTLNIVGQVISDDRINIKVTAKSKTDDLTFDEVLTKVVR